MNTDREEFERAVLALSSGPRTQPDFRLAGEEYKDALIQWAYEIWRKARCSVPEHTAQAIFEHLHPDSKWHKVDMEIKDRYRQLAESGQSAPASPVPYSAIRKLMSNWDDLATGESLDVDAVRAWLDSCGAPHQCTSEDAWNCKYCKKSETCEAARDQRNFAEKPQAPSKVAPLFEGLSPEGVPKPRIVAILEEALKEAKAGNVESLAIAYPCFSGATTTDWENTQNTLRSIGAVSHLLARMNLDLIRACAITGVENDG